MFKPPHFPKFLLVAVFSLGNRKGTEPGRLYVTNPAETCPGREAEQSAVCSESLGKRSGLAGCS